MFDTFILHCILHGTFIYYIQKDSNTVKSVFKDLTVELQRLSLNAGGLCSHVNWFFKQANSSRGDIKFLGKLKCGLF